MGRVTAGNLLPTHRDSILTCFGSLSTARTGPRNIILRGLLNQLAATDASKHSVWLRRLFADLGFPQHGPTSIYEGNESCVKLSRNYCGHDRVKHLDLRDMLVREHHKRGLTELISIPTAFQLADPLTKVLAGPQTRQFRAWALCGEALPSDLPVT